jgi:hypothetical protein
MSAFLLDNIPPNPINNDCIKIVIDSAIRAKKFADEIAKQFNILSLQGLSCRFNDYKESIEIVDRNIISLKDKVADDTVTMAIEIVSNALKSSLERCVVINKMSGDSLDTNTICDISCDCHDESKKVIKAIEAIKAITLVQNKVVL